LAKFISGISMPFFLLVDEYTGILSQLLKSKMGRLYWLLNCFKSIKIHFSKVGQSPPAAFEN